MSVRPLPPDVRRALECIEAEPGRAWSVAALAAEAGVSARTLQKHFRRHLGATPREALLDARLRKARRELLRQGGSVTDIATRAGFAHLGRFSARYRLRYGETPIATRRRTAPSGPLAFAPTAERPTLAVLPFAASGTAGPSAQGLADELAVALVRLRSVAVVAPEHARYRLQGSLRGDGRRLAATFRLVEAATGRLLWAERFDGPAEDVFALEERIAHGVVRALTPCLRNAEIERTLARDPAELSAYELAMRALPAAMALARGPDETALELLDRAMRLAPDQSLPAAVAAWCHAQRAGHHFTENARGERAAALELADRARRLDRGDPLALTMLSGAYALVHDLDAAEALAERAVALEPGSSWAWARSAWVCCYRGNAAEARERFQLALDLAPGDLYTFLCYVGLASAAFRERRYEDAARWWRRSLAEHPGSLWVHRFYAPALAFCGRKEEAVRSMAALRAAFPDLTIETVRAGLPLPGEYLERVAEGLESLGMPR